MLKYLFVVLCALAVCDAGEFHPSLNPELNVVNLNVIESREDSTVTQNNDFVRAAANPCENIFSDHTKLELPCRLTDNTHKRRRAEIRKLAEKTKQKQHGMMLLPNKRKKPDLVEVSDCYITVAASFRRRFNQISKLMNEETDSIIPLPCELMLDFLFAQLRKRPIPKNYIPAEGEANCTMTSFRKGRLRHRSLPCYRLESLMKILEPQPGQLDCAQPEGFTKNVRNKFYPCTIIEVEHKHARSFSVVGTEEYNSKLVAGTEIKLS